MDSLINVFHTREPLNPNPNATEWILKKIREIFSLRYE